jgi:hypothetical protein
MDTFIAVSVGIVIGVAIAQLWVMFSNRYHIEDEMADWIKNHHI